MRRSLGGKPSRASYATTVAYGALNLANPKHMSADNPAISPSNNPSTSASTQSGPGTVRYPATRTSWKSDTTALDPRSKQEIPWSLYKYPCIYPVYVKLYVTFRKFSREIVVEWGYALRVLQQCNLCRVATNPRLLGPSKCTLKFQFNPLLLWSNAMCRG